MSSFSLRDNLTIENGKALKWLDASGTSRKDVLTLDGFNAVKVNSAGADIYINSSVNSTTWVNTNNNNNVVVGSKLGVGTSTVSGVLTLPSNSVMSSDSTNGTITLTAGQDSSVSSSKIILSGNGTGGNLDFYTGSTSGSGIRFYTGSSSLKRFHIYDNGLFNFTPDGSTIALSLNTSNITTINQLLLQNTIDSTNVSTGSFIVSGGVAIQKVLNASGISTPTSSIGTLIVSGTGNITTLSSGNIWSAGTINANNLVATTSLSTGTLRVSGTANTTTISSGNIWSTGTINANTINTSLGTIGNLVATTSLSTGTLRSTDIVNSSTISTGTLRVSGTANATTISAGNIWSAGTINTLTVSSGNIGSSLGTIGTLLVSSSTNATGLGSGGSITALGGLSISRDAFIGGDLYILDTTDASGIGSGGALTIVGGAAISKRLFANTLSLGSISNEYSGSFSGNNNVSSPSNVTGLQFSTTDTRSFTVTMSIVILASTNLYSLAVIEGIYKNGTWEIFTSSLGDETNIKFFITSTGQITYTSSNYSSWVSTTFRWTAKVINQIGTHNPPTLPTSGSQTITGPLNITSTVNTTSGSSGSLSVAGGVGIAGDLVVGGNIFSNIWKTQIATSSFSVTESHKNFVFLVSNSMTINLLSAASAGINFCVGFTKLDLIDTSIQIIPDSGKIEDYSNILISNKNESVQLISDGTDWRILYSRIPVFYSIYSIPGVYTFQVPNPVTSVYACIFGAGGGGGSGNAGSSTGNGGGGGGYCEGVISVTPGEAITIIVGEGGTPDNAGGYSSVGDFIATGGGSGGINIIGNWGSNGSGGIGSGGIINRTGGNGGQSPNQITSGGGGGGGCAGRSASGTNANSYLGGNGSGAFGGAGANGENLNGTSLRLNNFYREGGGGGSGGITTALGMDGGFPGGGGSGSSDGTGGYGGDGCVIIYY